MFNTRDDKNPNLNVDNLRIYVALRRLIDNNEITHAITLFEEAAKNDPVASKIIPKTHLETAMTYLDRLDNCLILLQQLKQLDPKN